jgi:predicted nucleotidyltransferase
MPYTRSSHGSKFRSPYGRLLKGRELKVRSPQRLSLDIIGVCGERNVPRCECVALFCSVARNEAKAMSDIDIMIELEPTALVGLFEYVGITEYLADLFSNRVDVANCGSLKGAGRPEGRRRRGLCLLIEPPFLIRYP